MVMAVYAPDSKKSLESYEDCISSIAEVLREGRKGGARDFNITGDFNVELGLTCIDEKGNEELTKMYGPLCWQGYDKAPGGFKKSCGMESWKILIVRCPLRGLYVEKGEQRLLHTGT